MTRSLAVITAANDATVLEKNLAASPLVRTGGIPLLIEREHASAGAAYNAGMARTDAEVLVFAHQDVYLPHDWERRLMDVVDALERNKREWAVLGLYGVKRSGERVGRVWSSGLGREVGRPFDGAHDVVSVDELVIILRRACSLLFDAHLPGFHLYGTDIVQQALGKGYGAYVLHAPVIHNSNPVRELDASYWLAYRYEQRKWRETLPIPTCIMPITRMGWPRIRYRMGSVKKRLLQWRPLTMRQDDPVALARKLGYEQ